MSATVAAMATTRTNVLAVGDAQHGMTLVVFWGHRFAENRRNHRNALARKSGTSGIVNMVMASTASAIFWLGMLSLNGIGTPAMSVRRFSDDPA